MQCFTLTKRATRYYHITKLVDLFSLSMEARLGFLVFALLLVLYLPMTTGKRKCGRHQVCVYKTHEVSPYPITFKVCDNIISLYYGVCFPTNPAKRRKRRGGCRVLTILHILKPALALLRIFSVITGKI